MTENTDMKYCCNPLNVPYRYQFNADPRKGGALQICREAADLVAGGYQR